MTIQWFPGHMAKARREVTEQLKLVDIVIELVDARLPESSRNPMIHDIIQQKPRLILMNKRDLADEKETLRWLRHYESIGEHAIAINAFETKALKSVTKEAERILSERREEKEAKGIQRRAIRAMIVGVPNVGKSTLINRLAKRNIAKTGNTPGVTKGQQWIKVGSTLELLDTPGILWPKFEDEEIGYKLALTGAITDRILHMDNIAVYALQFLEERYPSRLQERYEIDTLSDDIAETFDAIGHLRKAYERGGEIDYEKVSNLIVQDVRSGQFGRLTFDIVPD
ncbi:ribosome biogenesis GTPase YlqF [Planococcaceae bacterium Storch 2/2-2]|nr:ribosome biogenesis GTPase YlqF [Planococcaceae bacterium Storch 2/2-2]